MGVCVSTQSLQQLQGLIPIIPPLVVPATGPTADYTEDGSLNLNKFQLLVQRMPNLFSKISVMTKPKSRKTTEFYCYVHVAPNKSLTEKCVFFGCMGVATGAFYRKGLKMKDLELIVCNFFSFQFWIF